MTQNNLSISANLISNPLTSSGVCTFSISCEGEILSNMYLRVYIPDQGYEAMLFKAAPNMRLGINTHLLPAGNFVICCEIICDQQTLAKSQLAFSLDVRNGLYQIVRDAQLKSNTPLFFEGGCDSSMYPYDINESIIPWFDRPDAYIYLQTLLHQNQITEQEYGYLLDFIERGFIQIEGLIDHILIDSVNIEIDDAIEKGYQGYKKQSSQRLEMLHEHYPFMRKLWLDKRHRRIVDLVFGVPARPTQTLTFVCGSQQPPHSDLVYLTPFPAGYMCGTWIALQDVVEGSGELVVYPGSHRERRIYLKDTGFSKVVGDDKDFNQHIYGAWAEISRRYKPVIYRPKKGSILIWHENLLHGGSARIDQSLERRSVVIHSFADGACVYYDNTGSAGHVAPLKVINE